MHLYSASTYVAKALEYGIVDICKMKMFSTVA